MSGRIREKTIIGAKQKDPLLIVGGSFSGTGINRIARLNLTGGTDTSFSIGTGFNGEVNAVCIDSNNKILVGGYFTSYSGVSKNRIVRLNTDGSIDNTFNIGNEGFNSSVFVITTDNSGGIYVGGDFTLYSGNSCNRIIKLNDNGSVDTSFNIETGFDNSVWDIEIDSENNIWVGGDFNFYKGSRYDYIVKLYPNGSVHSSFVRNQINGGGVYAICIDTYDIEKKQLFIGGSFTGKTGGSCYKIAKLDSDGILRNADTNFSSSDVVLSLALDYQRNLYVGGEFLGYSGISSQNIIKLNSELKVNTSFNSGVSSPGFDSGRVLSIFPVNSKVYIGGGSFSTYNHSSAYGMIRINSDGSLDTTFTQQLVTSIVNSVYSIKYKKR